MNETYLLIQAFCLLLLSTKGKSFNYFFLLKSYIIRFVEELLCKFPHLVNVTQSLKKLLKTDPQLLSNLSFLMPILYYYKLVVVTIKSTVQVKCI